MLVPVVFEQVHLPIHERHQAGRNEERECSSCVDRLTRMHTISLEAVVQTAAFLLRCVLLQIPQVVRPAKVKRDPAGAGDYPAVAELGHLFAQSLSPLAVARRAAEEYNATRCQELSRPLKHFSSETKAVVVFAGRRIRNNEVHALRQGV